MSPSKNIFYFKFVAIKNAKLPKSENDIVEPDAEFNGEYHKPIGDRFRPRLNEGRQKNENHFCKSMQHCTKKMHYNVQRLDTFKKAILIINLISNKHSWQIFQ
jgi:hypothetical protein